MSYFDKCPPREQSHSFKYSETIMNKKLGRSDLEPLWVADMDFRCPPCVIDAVKNRADHGIYGYSTMADDHELPDLVAQWQQDRLDWSAHTSWISYSPGVVNSIYYLLLSLCEPGDKVIVQNPVYGPFRIVVGDAQCQWVNNQLLVHETEQGPEYRMDLSDLEAKASDPQCKVLLLCSPSNPGGRVWSFDELKAVEEICRKNDVFVISDEIHGDLTFPGSKHHPWPLVAEDDRWAVLVSPSKTFNIPGLGTSFAIIQDEKLRRRFNMTKYSRHGAMENPFGLVAAKAAYTGAAPWLDDLRNYLAENYRLLKQGFEGRFPLFYQQSTYLSWIDASSLGGLEDIRDYFFEQRSMGVQLGRDFGPGGEGFVRFNFAIPRDNLKKILKKI